MPSGLGWGTIMRITICDRTIDLGVTACNILIHTPYCRCSASDGGTPRARATPEPERSVRETTFPKLYAIAAALLLGCLGALPAQAQFHGTGCASQYDQTGEVFFTANTPTLVVPNLVQQGDYVGPWYGRVIRTDGWGGGNNPTTFSVCTDTSQVHSDDDSSKLIPVGALALGVNPQPLSFVTEDGYSVYTTLQLNSAGLGFAVRWKAYNHWGEEGAWVSPSGVWTGEVFEQNKGLSFWRWLVTYNRNGLSVQGRTQPNHLLQSLANWNLLMGSYPPPKLDPWPGEGYFGIHYDAWVEVRYVAIGPSPSEYVPNDHTLTVDIVRMLAMPARRLHANGWLMKHRVHVRRLPHGTCQTPFQKDVVVALQADIQDLYTNTVSTTPTQFSLSLLDCPLVDVGLSFRVPQGIEVVNATQGIIGLDSTATAQGVGVRLRHRGGWFNNAVVTYQADGESQTYWRTKNDGVPSGLGGQNHTIPLEAAVVRTGSVITPGTIRASLLVLIRHQ